MTVYYVYVHMTEQYVLRPVRMSCDSININVYNNVTILRILDWWADYLTLIHSLCITSKGACVLQVKERPFVSRTGHTIELVQCTAKW